MTADHEEGILRAYKKPKSICICGHTGDLSFGDNMLNSDHAGVLGLGACTKCNCAQFLWRSWTPEFASYYEAKTNKKI